MPPSAELPLDEELLPLGNTVIGHHGGFEGNRYQSDSNETDQTLLGGAPEVTDVFGMGDVTPIDDEPLAGC